MLLPGDLSPEAGSCSAHSLPTSTLHLSRLIIKIKLFSLLEKRRRVRTEADVIQTKHFPLLWVLDVRVLWELKPPDEFLPLGHPELPAAPFPVSFSPHGILSHLVFPVATLQISAALDFICGFFRLSR